MYNSSTTINISGMDLFNKKLSIICVNIIYNPSQNSIKVLPLEEKNTVNRNQTENKEVEITYSM